MFLNSDLIGQQEDIELFNNIGCLDNSKGHLDGRLTVWLAINHIPRIKYEFETARKVEVENNFYQDILFEPQEQLSSWEGSNPQLIIENPESTFRGGDRYQSRGYAKQVLYGDIKADAHYFEFYLPNTDFIRNAVGHDLKTTEKALKIKVFEAEIGNDWSIRIDTTQEALDWLNPQEQHKGSMITLKVCLFQTKHADMAIQDLKFKSLADAQKIVSDLCLMLSYINGGYVEPIYGIAKKLKEVDGRRIPENIAALAQGGSLIAPQEELGQGCIRNWGMEDLLNFIRCFPSFERMLKTPHWRKKWIVILEWYFQSIIRVSGRRRNNLPPVSANALGALLENLAKIILVDEGLIDEEQNSTKKKEKKYEELCTKCRYKKLLNQIGILGEDIKVHDFVRIRNNSTHAINKPLPLDEKEQWEIILTAVQWVDEVILWRIGYEGKYIERTIEKFNNPIAPRYDLSRRNPIW